MDTLLKQTLQVTIRKEVPIRFKIHEGKIELHPDMLLINNTHLALASRRIVSLSVQISDLINIERIKILAKTAESLHFFKDEEDTRPANLADLFIYLLPEKAPMFRKALFAKRDVLQLWDSLR